MIRTLVLALSFMFIFSTAYAVTADEITDEYIKPLGTVNPVNNDAGIVYEGVTYDDVHVIVLFFYGEKKNYGYLITKSEAKSTYDKIVDDWSVYDKLKSIADNRER